MSSEAWLIRKAKKGDTKAYGELIQLHKDYFYRNAFCYVKNVDLAGDVFQEAVTIDLHNAVESLEEPYRTIIKQKYFEDKKISEIAAYTGRADQRL